MIGPTKFLCPKCQKMTLTVWPGGRKQCTNDRCQYKEK